ncbi:MAG: nickel pincer cofactor biosynthesis protein LarB, partial [Bacillota bacterium]
MREDYIKDILAKVKEGSMSEEAAFDQLKELPYKEMGFANLDNHRQIRTGFPEVVYCEGKTPGQVGEIFEA